MVPLCAICQIIMSSISLRLRYKFLNLQCLKLIDPFKYYLILLTYIFLVIFKSPASCKLRGISVLLRYAKRIRALANLTYILGRVYCSFIFRVHETALPHTTQVAKGVEVIWVFSVVYDLVFLDATKTFIC